MTALEYAMCELGYTESPGGSNRTKYGEWYGLNGVPWCMEFVQWCFAMAGTPLPYRTASCSALLGWYVKNRPEDVHDEPMAGDIIIYTFGHTGIVESATGDTVKAVEGNTSPGEAGSQDNGGGVYRRTRKRSLVEAYIRPYGEEKEMSYEKFLEYMEKYMDETAERPLPEWAREEYQAAMDAGITDGARPMAYIPRYQAAIMALRGKK